VYVSPRSPADTPRVLLLAVPKRAGKGKGIGAPGAARASRTTAYSNAQLARVVRSVVLQNMHLEKTKLGHIQTELAKYVQCKVTAQFALRVRTQCVYMMHGESRAGAARLPAIAEEMRKLGYFAKVHYASKVEMIDFTLAGLQSQHAQIQRGLKKADRKVFNEREVLLQLAALFISACCTLFLHSCSCVQPYVCNLIL